MEHQIVSGADGKTVIGKCRFDERAGGFCDTRTVDGEDKFVDLNATAYDDEQVYRANDCLNLKHARGIYNIELSRLDTPVKAHQWIVHLLEKSWVSRDMLSQMVQILERHFDYNLAEFTDAADTRPFETPTKARRCTFNRKINTIDIRVTPGYVYQVDLAECVTSQGVLDWIHQVHQKAWGSEVIDEFLEILFDHIPSKLWLGV